MDRAELFASPLLASVDVLCLPATDLTGKVDLPLVVLEGMQAGRPVIVTDQGPLRELGDESHGVLLTPPRADAVASALGTLTPSLGERAQSRVEARFASERMAAAYVTLYG